MQRPILSFPYVESNYFIKAIYLFLANTIVVNDRIKQFKSTLLSKFCSTHRFTKQTNLYAVIGQERVSQTLFFPHMESEKRRDPGTEIETMYESRISGFSSILRLRYTQHKNNKLFKTRFIQLSNFSFHFLLSDTSDIRKYPAEALSQYTKSNNLK